VLKKQDYERMQIEQKKLEQEVADTVKQRSRHTSAESGGWMESAEIIQRSKDAML